MELLNRETHIDFLRWRRWAVLLSLMLIVISIVSLATRGLNFGIDFTGGTMIELGYVEAADLDAIRSQLHSNGLPEALVQNFGSIREVMVRLPTLETDNMAELSNQVLTLLQAQQSDPIEIRRVEFVGPQVGEELTEDGGLAMLYALFGILIYVALRFEYRFAFGSIIALVHDVILTLGFFSLFQLEFDLTVLAAILAVIGYSLNDTIVVFDRIRETFLRMRKGSPEEVINTALNNTLSRTVMTSMTTLLVVLALFFFGGDVIHAFALALMLGVIIGTYSSIYIASTAILAMGVSKADLMPPEKEGVDPENPDGSQV